jgi:type I restriction enzyme, R subunit
MAEYINVERPFLAKLEDLGWKVVDHGAHGIPQNPQISFRDNFDDVVLESIFKKTVSKINITEDGYEWLTDKQLDEVFIELVDQGSKNLHEANKDIFHKVLANTTVDTNELTGEPSPLVRFIDFDDWKNNSFIAINQFRINTPGGPREAIIPDIVLFVNGLPFVVIECKDIDVSEPLSEAEIQIRRYSNRRDDDFGVKEGKERLFHFNLFSIITHGTEARFGTISADFDYYFNWKDIFPEEYKVIQIDQDNEKTQEVMIHGMLNKEILIDVFRHFTLFMELKEGVEIKIVSRYQQYRAVGKIIEGLRNGTTKIERSGVIWHTQGSGKSLTMVFLVRKLRSSEDLKDYKVLMVNDRRDLEDQLSKTAMLTGESVNFVNHRKELRPTLSNDSSNLNMIMVHKFLEEEIRHSKALMKAYVEESEVPEFKPFEVVNESDRVLMLIDEAHRTQGGDMGDNLFTAFPNAAKIAFTGTPLLTKRHKVKTHERFGDFIDTYKIKESVRDRATLDIVYIGRTSKDKVKDPDGFHKDFEDVFKERTKEEKLEIQKRYGTMRAYLENMDRLRKIAEDIVEHYTTEIMVNGFKAQVVASSVLAAARYENLIKAALANKVKIEEAKDDDDRDDDFIMQLKFLEVCTVVSMQDNNEIGYISAARKKAKDLNAIENFKKDFDYDKPETGIGILCVCDRLLTGFDAPVEQAMYLDKNMREHDLLQTIARVNRTKGPKKKHGIVVDYFGIANHLKDAFAIYGEEDEKELKEFLEYFRDINKEIPVLEARYNRLIQLFSDNGIGGIEDFVNQKMTDKKEEFDLAESCIDLAKEIRFRAQFDTYIKAFFDSLDLLFNVEQAKKYYIPAKRFGYLLIRIKNRYRDDTMDLKWAGEKVRKLIDKHLQSLGIDSKVPPVSLMSDEFPEEIDKLSKSSKAKASDMEHAIRRHIKVNLSSDPQMYTKFNERLEAILKQFKGNWDIIATEFDKLRDAMKKNEYKPEDGLDHVEDVFYRNIIDTAFKNKKDPAKNSVEENVSVFDPTPNDEIKKIVIEIVQTLREKMNIPNFWKKPSEVKKLKGIIDDKLDFCDIDAFSDKHEKICAEILSLAKKIGNKLRQDVE